MSPPTVKITRSRTAASRLKSKEVRSTYPFHLSVITVVPLLTYVVTMLERVGASRLFPGQMERKQESVCRCIPPTTQVPSTSLPLLNFLFPNFASSTSTMVEGPPILGLVRISSAICSRRTPLLVIFHHLV